MIRSLSKFAIILPLLFVITTPACLDSTDDADLTIYSGRRETLVAPVIERFSHASGLKVRVKYGESSHISATLLEEGKKTKADIFLAQDPASLGSVLSLLTPLPSDILDQVPPWARSDVGLWVGVSARARVVAYNTKKYSDAEMPDDVMGFVGRQWKERIGWNLRSTSSQVMVTAMRVLWGETKTLAWLNGLRANSTHIFASNTSALAAVASGEIDVAFVNHYYLHQALAQTDADLPVANYHPRAGGPGALIMVTGGGVLSTAPHQANALEFLDFLLASESQDYFSNTLYEYPLKTGVRTSLASGSLSSISHPRLNFEDLMDMVGTQRLLRETGTIP